MRKIDCLLVGVALWLAATSNLSGADAPGKSRREAADVVAIPDSVHPLARRENDLGAPSPDTWMDGLTIMLRPRAGTAEELERLLAEQQRPGSASYHRWLTPDDYGRRFGVPDEDLFSLIAWLEGGSVRVSEPPRGRGWLNVSGTVGDLERAFSTRIRRYGTGESEQLGNESALSVPRRFAGLVAEGSSLAVFPARSLLRKVPVPSRSAGKPWAGARPLFTSPSGNHALAPADFAAIYNVAPLYARGVTGKGVTIAIVSTSNVNLDDVRRFRSFFGLPARDPQIVLNGPDPGKIAAEDESDLDIEWSGAVAPDADILLVLTGGGGDTLFISAQYAVNQNTASILSLSFGSCESTASRGWDALWKQASTQGISVFVASGDSGCSWTRSRPRRRREAAASTGSRPAPTPSSSEGPSSRETSRIRPAIGLRRTRRPRALRRSPTFPSRAGTRAGASSPARRSLPAAEASRPCSRRGPGRTRRAFPRTRIGRCPTWRSPRPRTIPTSATPGRTPTCSARREPRHRHPLSRESRPSFRRRRGRGSET